MPTDITSDPSLDLDLVLMRYLDLAKFIDLISTKTLYVASAVQFDDQLEGTLPEDIREMYRTDPEILAHLGPIPVREKENENRVRTNISCWTKGTADNMALWKIYGASKQSLAIQTSLRSLFDAAWQWKELPSVLFKDVIYIDHAGRLPDGVFTLDKHIFGLKHQAYSYENEVRMIITRHKLKEPSPLRLDIEPDSLIEKIIVSPEAGDWFYNIIQSVSMKYDIKAPIEYSKLTELIDKA